MVREAVPGVIRKAKHFVMFLRTIIEYLQNRLKATEVTTQSPDTFMKHLGAETQLTVMIIPRSYFPFLSDSFFLACHYSGSAGLSLCLRPVKFSLTHASSQGHGRNGSSSDRRELYNFSFHVFCWFHCYYGGFASALFILFPCPH
jgi:hypothetical protein